MNISHLWRCWEVHLSSRQAVSPNSSHCDEFSQLPGGFTYCIVYRKERDINKMSNYSFNIFVILTNMVWTLESRPINYSFNQSLTFSQSQHNIILVKRPCEDILTYLSKNIKISIKTFVWSDWCSFWELEIKRLEEIPQIEIGNVPKTWYYSCQDTLCCYPGVYLSLDLCTVNSVRISCWTKGNMFSFGNQKDASHLPSYLLSLFLQIRLSLLNIVWCLVSRGNRWHINGHRLYITLCVITIRHYIYIMTSHYLLTFLCLFCFSLQNEPPPPYYSVAGQPQPPIWPYGEAAYSSGPGLTPPTQPHYMPQYPPPVVAPNVTPASKCEGFSWQYNRCRCMSKNNGDRVCWEVLICYCIYVFVLSVSSPQQCEKEML